MATQHDDLVSLVGARQLREDVERVLILGDRVLDRQLHRDRHLLVERARHPIVVFDRDHHLGWRRRRVGDEPTLLALRIVGRTLLHEDRAAIAASRLEHRQHAFAGEELEPLA